MRTVFIAVAVAGSLTACTLYFSDSEHPTQIGRPDASPSSDGGHWDYPDAAYWDANSPDSGTGCHDAGSPAPDAGPCGCGGPDAPPAPDAGPRPDARY